MFAKWILCALLVLSGPAVLAGGQGEADLILVGGKVLTLTDPEPRPQPTAVAIGSDRIVFVGQENGALSWRTAGSTVIDLDGAVVIPGFCDGHAHLYGLGKALSEVDLRGTGSAAEVVERAVAFAASLPADAWLQGRGWDQNDWPVQEFPHRNLLDREFADRPVLLRRVDGHAGWANGEALRRAGITADRPDTAGGLIIRDEHGEPTGVLIDNAIELVRNVIPPVTATEISRRVGLATANCLRLGLTGVHEAGVTAARLAVYKEMAAAGELPIRLYGMLEDKPDALAALAAGPFEGSDKMLTVRAVKLYADGALGSRGALLLADYSDDPGNSGLLVTPADHLRDVARRAGRAGFQVCTHAIGDGGNRLVLDLYEQVLGELAGADRRWRIEHAQVLHPADIPRFAGLGVIASMQPVHCTSDMDWAEERLGPERVRGAYAWRLLLDSGARLCFGTDFPVELVDPLHGLFSARTRTHHDGSPAGGWFPEQCLSGREALRLYTAGPAYASFREDELGAVQPGRLADLTVLSGDPVACEPAALLDLRVLLTVVGGKIRYDGRGL